MLKTLLIANADVIAQVIFFLVATFVLTPLYRKLKLDNNSKRAAFLETAIKKGLNAAIQALTTGKSVAATLTTIINDNDMRIEAVSQAKDYVQDYLPDTLKKLGITDDHLAAMVNARVEDALEELAKRYTNINAAITQSVDNLSAT